LQSAKSRLKFCVIFRLEKKLILLSQIKLCEWLLELLQTKCKEFKKCYMKRLDWEGSDSWARRLKNKDYIKSIESL
jgi:hypothetical protein